MVMDTPSAKKNQTRISGNRCSSAERDFSTAGTSYHVCLTCKGHSSRRSRVKNSGMGTPCLQAMSCTLRTASSNLPWDTRYRADSGTLA
jgi:hypothetical protein